MALRVGIISSGTRGDVRPFLALAQELQSRGHQVAICCASRCLALVHEHGLEGYGLTFDPKAAILGEEMQRAIEAGDGAGCIRAINQAQQRQVRDTGVDPAEEVKAFVEAFRPTVLVGHPSFVPLIVVAEAFSLPLVNALFMPFLPSRVVQPGWYTEAQLKQEGFLGQPLKAHRDVWDNFLNPSSLEQLNELRASWGLPLYKDVPELQAVYQSAPEANCWSRSMLPEPCDMAQEFPLAEQTGYLFADAPVDYELPQELLSFLQRSDQKPLYVGFGSLCVGDPRLATEKVLRALKKAGQRCILAGGWAGMNPAHLSPTETHDFAVLMRFANDQVFHLEAAPHDQLLPLCRGAVHHGGAGTVAAVARAGIPGAILPVAWDQPWWAEHLEKQGVGLSLRTTIAVVEEAPLAAAFAQLGGDEGLAQRAAALGRRIRQETPGRQRLADFVERCVTMPHPWSTQAQPVPPALLPALWERELASADEAEAEAEAEAEVRPAKVCTAGEDYAPEALLGGA